MWPQPSPDRGWEAPFYRSLAEANGVILMGGGKTTYIAGIIAIATRLPAVALAGFGGEALEVLKLLERDGHPAPKEDRHLMGTYEGNAPDKAKALVRSLATQRKYIKAAKSAQTPDAGGSARSIWGIAALVLAMLMTACAVFTANLTFGLLLFGIPMVGGAAGALAHTLPSTGKRTATPAPYPIRAAIFLGMLAGFVTAMGFLVSNIITSLDFGKLTEPAYLGATQRLMIFNLIISIIAGFTLEKTLKAIRGVDVGKHADVLSGETSGSDKLPESAKNAGR